MTPYQAVLHKILQSHRDVMAESPDALLEPEASAHRTRVADLHRKIFRNPKTHPDTFHAFLRDSNPEWINTRGLAQRMLSDRIGS